MRFSSVAARYKLIQLGFKSLESGTKCCVVIIKHYLHKINWCRFLPKGVFIFSIREIHFFTVTDKLASLLPAGLYPSTGQSLTSKTYQRAALPGLVSRRDTRSPAAVPAGCSTESAAPALRSFTQPRAQVAASLQAL